MESKKSNNKKTGKRIKDRAYELEEFTFQDMLDDFIKKSKELKADYDNVNEKAKEYVYTSQLYPLYKQAFGKAALAINAIQYRLRKIKENHYRDDFYILKDVAEVVGGSKYIVNRLNLKLLKKIYLPYVGGGLSYKDKQVFGMEDDFRAMNELSDIDFDDDDDF